MPITLNKIVIAGTVTGTSVTHSQHLPHTHGYAVHAKWTGTGITGLVKLQASLNGTDFIDVSDSQENFTAAGEILWDISEANYNHFQIWCESTSGAVTFEVWLTLKRDSNLV